MRSTITAVRQALATLFPIHCVGCGALDIGVCRACTVAVRANCVPGVVELAPGIPVAYASGYDDRMRALATAYKERGRVDAVRLLAPLLRASLLTLLRAHPASGVLLVPVPSRRAARVQRGFDHVELLVEWAVRARGVRGLRHARGVLDQAGLGRRARYENLHGALRASGCVAGRTCILVDDFMTTGATLREAARALDAQGARVLGAAVVARVEAYNRRVGNS